MIGNVVSRRYAAALFSIGKERGMEELERYGASLSALGEAVEKTPKLAETFRNPVLSSEEKKKVVLALLDVAGVGAKPAGDEEPVEKRFCALLADKGRLDAAALKLARDKFEAAERRENAARNALGDTKLTDAAKIAKMKEIFG